MGVQYPGVRELAVGFGKVPLALRRELRPALRIAGQRTLDDMRGRASYSTRIPAATSMTVSFSAKGGGIRYKVNRRLAPHARPLELGNRRSRGSGTFRHPVFGRWWDWTSQPTRPFFFPAFDAHRAQTQERIGVAVRASLREVRT